MVIVAPTGRIALVNAEAERLFGYARSELANQPVEMLIPERFRTDHQRQRQAFNREGRNRAMNSGLDLFGQRKDGSEFPAEISLRRIAASEGTLIVTAIRDVTERKKLEQESAEARRLKSESALRASEARFARLSESGIVGIVHADVFGNVHDANDAYLRMIGYARDDLASGALKWSALTPPEWREADEQALSLLKLSGAAHPWEKELLRKDGTRVPILIGVAMLDYPNTITFVTDMTARKLAEKERRDVEARFQLLFDTIPLPTFVYDADSLQILEVNEAAVKSYGYTRDELRRMNGADLSPHDEVLRLKNVLEATGPGPTYLGVWKHRKSDGTVFDVELTGSSLTFGQRRARLALAPDVSERRRLEAQLRQAQKMEAVGQFAGGVAHDFNNTLSVVLSYCELALADLPPGNAIREDLEEIQKAGERAATLTRQLLAFSRKQVLAPRPVNLNEIITQMDRMLRRLIGEHINLVTHPAEDLGTVNVDPGQMEQVLMNLAVNARDAMPTGGELTIETANEDLDDAFAVAHPGMKPGPHARLVVKDTGQGMSAATQARLFEPFFTTKEMGKGTGLGLSTVFGIVQQSGGAIEVHSELTRGTCFTIHLPRPGVPARELPAPIPIPKDLRGDETILIVEDEDQVRNAACIILERSGYRVLRARNAGEAILICERSKEDIALLITDVVMPQMSGPEVAERLVATRPEMRVLCMSGHTDSAMLSGGVAAGLAFLEKPFTREGLARRVREVLDAPRK